MMTLHPTKDMMKSGVFYLSNSLRELERHLQNHLLR